MKKPNEDKLTEYILAGLVRRYQGDCRSCGKGRNARHQQGKLDGGS